VTDCFAAFGFSRRPGLDTSELKEKYLQLASASHPDSGGGDGEFQAVQQAYKTLLDPALRLRHLRALEFEGTENSSGPAHQELFLKVGAVMQQAKALQQRLEKSRSSLSRALAIQDGKAVLRLVRETQQAVEQARAERDRDLTKLDERWPEVAPAELTSLAAGLTFLARWRSELAEVEFRLAQEK
jgi:curved DNA-binding protein CbpA